MTAFLENLRTIGARAWRESYARLPPGSYKRDPEDIDPLVSSLLQSFLVSSGKVPTYRVAPNYEGAAQSVFLQFMFGAKWTDSACRMVHVDDKYFAALCATSIGEDTLQELHVPWPAFVIRVPPKLLVAEGVEYRWIAAAQFANVGGRVEGMPPEEALDAAINHKLDPMALLILSPDETDAPCIWRFVPGTLQSLAEKVSTHKTSTNWDCGLGIDPTSQDDRAMTLAVRALFGVCFAFQFTNHWRASAFSGVSTGKAYRDCPPPHRVILMGRPMSLDVRKAVSDSIVAKTHGAPTVQTLVRGHLKRQVVGPGRGGRRVIWIEPYWRGPEEAPILSRPYSLSRARA